MSVRNVLVLGDSPHAAGLLEQLDQDPGSQRQPDASELPDVTILAGSGEGDLAVAMSLLESDRPLIVVAGPHLAAAAVHRLALVASDARVTIRCWLPAVRELAPLETPLAPAPSRPRVLKSTTFIDKKSAIYDSGDFPLPSYLGLLLFRTTAI